jgi:hypothetical protein
MAEVLVAVETVVVEGLASAAKVMAASAKARLWRQQLYKVGICSQ